MNTHVFISYRRSDSAVVEELVAALSDRYRCWRDTSKIAGGQRWREEISLALDASYAMILVLSPDTEQSKEVYAECFYALGRKVPIIPLLVAKCELPFGLESVNSRLWYEDKQQAVTNLRSDLELYRAQAPSLELVSDKETYLRAMQLGYLMAVGNYTPMAGEGRHRLDRTAQVPRAVVMRPEFSLRRSSPLFRDRQVVEHKRAYEDLLPALHDSKRVVLLGEPGIGKTTTLYKFADELRQQVFEKDSAPIPLIIPLREWRDDLGWQALMTLHLGVLAPRFEELCARQGLYFLLDGLNELPRDDRRETKLEALRELLLKATSVVVTCRELDYRDEGANLDLDTITIHPLNAERVRDFLRRYLVDAIGETDGEAAAEDLFWEIGGGPDLKDIWKKWSEAGASLNQFFGASEIPEAVRAVTDWRDNTLWQDIVKTPRNLMRLAANPYLLWMFLNIYLKVGTIPSNRGALFDEFVFQLLKREGLSEFEKLSVQGQALSARLEELAWNMQSRSAESDEWGGMELTIGREEALRILGGVQELYRAASANVLEDAEHVQFTHQLLQEYFTARRMLSEILRDQLKGEDLWPKEYWWQPSGWDEAAILAVGMSGKQAGKIIDWLSLANPEVAMLAIDGSGVEFDDELKLRAREILLPQMTDLDQHPEAGARSAIARGLGRVTLRNGTPLDDRPGVGLGSDATPTIEWIQFSGGRVELEGVDGEVTGVNIVIDVKSFRIACYLVTNLQFDAFIHASNGYANEEWWEGIERGLEPFSPAWTETNFPRGVVSWYEAVAFCRWLTKQHREQGLLARNQEIRLPTEWEWQFAATDGNRYNIYPWGPKWDTTRCNNSGSHIYGPSSVGIYPHGTWPKGPLDMAGNVWEWCLNKFQNPKDPQATSADRSGDDRALRGGSFGSRANECRTAERLGISPASRSDHVGFRVIRAIR